MSEGGGLFYLRTFRNMYFSRIFRLQDKAKHFYNVYMQPLEKNYEGKTHQRGLMVRKM